MIPPKAGEVGRERASSPGRNSSRRLAWSFRRGLCRLSLQYVSTAALRLRALAEIPGAIRRDELHPGLLASTGLAAPGDKKRVTMATLDALEESIEMLKVAFERYFNGVDRIPPTRDHDQVKRNVATLLTIRGGPTAVRFRLQNLKARLVTYEHYWTRILLQIEKGTFKRLLAESERRQHQAQSQRRTAEVEPSADAESESEPAPARASQSGRHPIPARSPTPPSRPTLPPGVDAGEARELFKQFVAAKKAVGEPIAGLTYGKLVDKLSRELPQLEEKHGGSIRFEVATVNGKVRLRARSRTEQTPSPPPAAEKPSPPRAAEKPSPPPAAEKAS